MKVLLCEDEEVLLELVKDAMESSGFQVACARDGRQAWELFDREPVGLVVSDWMMPDMDGLELCRKIRERPSTDYAYFILLTANAGKDNLRRAMELGVDDFLAKPIEFEDLRVRMRVAERIVGLTRRVAQLEGILPICMYCKNIREADNTYERIEAYIAKRTQAQFSHGICPQCMAERHPDV